MKGIIDSAQAQAAPEKAVPAAGQQQVATPEGDKGPQKYKTKVVEAIPPEMREAFEKIVLAGMKVLYSKDMQPEIQQVLAKPAPMWKKLAEGIAQVMTLLDHQSGKKLPQEIIIPAAIELVHEYAAFLNKGGKYPVSPEDLKQATQYVVIATAKLYGVPDEQIHQMFGAPAGGQPAEAAPADPAAPPVDPNAPPEEV